MVSFGAKMTQVNFLILIFRGRAPPHPKRAP